MTDRRAQRVRSFGETVFATYTRLAKQHDAVNLGQGYPDFAPPEFVTTALRDAADGYQQYSPLEGHPELLAEIAADHGQYQGRDLDPTANVLVTVGATEGLFASMQSLVDPGDEVIVFEPFYDAYPADVRMAGGTPVFVPLRADAEGTWSLDEDALSAAATDATKVIIVNSPHNPTGKVFTPAELDAIVKVAERVDALILSDEVYEHIAFEGHHRIGTRPGAWERTITLSSFGKSFSVTGWKVGWAVGPEHLITAVRMAHQWIPFVVATPLQRAAAQVLREARERGYYADLVTTFARKRDLLIAELAGTPFVPLQAEGGYFVMANAAALGYEDDVALCRDLPARAGVAAIPPSAFYSEAHKDLAAPLVRFAFCKEDQAIHEAGRRLRERLR